MKSSAIFGQENKTLIDRQNVRRSLGIWPIIFICSSIWVVQELIESLGNVINNSFNEDLFMDNTQETVRLLR